jgi:hypothetical protein
MRVPTAKEFFFTAPPLDARTREERERAFFHAIRLRNGSNKTTYAHRLDSVNQILNRFLPAHRPLDVMDVGASSGISTLEWMDHLDNAGVEYRMTAADACVKAHLLSFTRWLNILVDGTGYPLQFDILGRAVPYPPGLRRTILHPPISLLTHAFRWVLPRLPAARRRDKGIEIVLINPHLKERAVEIVEDDLLAPGAFEGRFDVVRAANVLNRYYFSDEALAAMAANLCRRLRSRGILTVCRTDEHNVTHGTVFRSNQSSRLEVLCRIGAGSDIEALILGKDSATSLVRTPESMRNAAGAGRRAATARRDGRPDRDVV